MKLKKGDNKLRKNWPIESDLYKPKKKTVSVTAHDKNRRVWTSDQL